MMDDLARLYRFIEDAEFKAAILEVLIDLGRQLASLGHPTIIDRGFCTCSNKI
jgi:hypothetical protein